MGVAGTGWPGLGPVVVGRRWVTGIGGGSPAAGRSPVTEKTFGGKHNILLSANIALRSAVLSVGGCSIWWWRLRWAATMRDGGSGGLGKLGPSFSFVIDVRLLFFDLQQNGGCDGDPVVAMLPPLHGR
ncbi:hypothetical protein TIFTF001_034509 [Ficus carica]|uniref:Uncharacterized protein n=1 Tax=Ficus carica TaxID=3494 RepID=A0AA88E0C2_FICCA|nr:hypothetical protein TIFTF001_034509 [Ficus carica]